MSEEQQQFQKVKIQDKPFKMALLMQEMWQGNNPHLQWS